MTTKYHVCWGPNAVAFVEVPDGSAFQTGQPNDEVFDVRDDAARRAFELNYTGIKVFDLQEQYDTGEYVRFSDNLYKALIEIYPFSADSDLEEPEEPVLPGSSSESWLWLNQPDLLL